MTDNQNIVREFVEAFEQRSAEKIAPFLHDDIVFVNYGDPPVHGKAAVLKLWEAVFSMFAYVRFEILHQATEQSVILSEQIHFLGQAGKTPAPIRNMAAYEIKDGLIAAWRDYTDSNEARRLWVPQSPSRWRKRTADPRSRMAGRRQPSACP
jgi:limonene-1,2-epoxide hydrolase